MRQSLLLCWGGLLFSVLGAGCSTASDQYQPITSTPDEYCQRRCDKAHACMNTINPAECRSSCQSALATQPKLRADFLGYIASCSETSSCGAELTTKCQSEAVAQLSISKYGQSFCAAFVAAGTQCDDSGASYPESACTEAARTYDDSALKAANDCFSKACSELSACLTHTMPEVMLAP